MMKFRKRVTKSGKRTSGKRTLSCQQRKQQKSYKEKNVFKRLSDTYVSTLKIQYFISEIRRKQRVQLKPRIQTIIE